MCQEVSMRACNDTNPTFGTRKDEQSHVKNATEATYSSVKLMQPRRAETRVLAGKSQRDERLVTAVYQFSDYNETTFRARAFFSLSFRKKTHISIMVLFNAFFKCIYTLFLLGIVLHFLHIRLFFFNFIHYSKQVSENYFMNLHKLQYIYIYRFCCKLLLFI